jgi:hypothetical protein
MVERLKVAAAVIRETFKHPLTTSVISVDHGAVTVTRDSDQGHGDDTKVKVAG